jgi:hypothetical protein
MPRIWMVLFLSVLVLGARAQTAAWSVGSWHRGAVMSVKSYGYVGGVVQGKFFPAAPNGPKWLFIVRQEGP